MNKLLLIAMAFLFVSCSYKPPLPEGFAHWESRYDYKAIHPDGIVYRLKEIDNDEEADLKYWTKAVQTRMENSGYKIKDYKSHKGKVGEISELSYLAPWSGKSYEYKIVLTLKDDDILVLEIAGKLKDMKAEEENIKKSILALGVE